MREWNELTHVSLDKVASVHKRLEDGNSVMITSVHVDLARHLRDEIEVTFDYCYGQEKRRLKQIEELGFKLERTIWRNTEAKYSRIKQVFKRS